MCGWSCGWRVYLCCVCCMWLTVWCGVGGFGSVWLWCLVGVVCMWAWGVYGVVCIELVGLVRCDCVLIGCEWFIWVCVLLVWFVVLCVGWVWCGWLTVWFDGSRVGSVCVVGSCCSIYRGLWVGVCVGVWLVVCVCCGCW